MMSQKDLVGAYKSASRLPPIEKLISISDYDLDSVLRYLAPSFSISDVLSD